MDRGVRAADTHPLGLRPSVQARFTSARRRASSANLSCREVIVTTRPGARSGFIRVGGDVDRVHVTVSFDGPDAGSRRRGGIAASQCPRRLSLASHRMDSRWTSTSTRTRPKESTGHRRFAQEFDARARKVVERRLKSSDA